MRLFSRLLASACFVLTALGCAADAARGDEEIPPANPRTRTELGVGFLWTMESRAVATELTSANDFIDVILTPGKAGLFGQIPPHVRVACIALSLEKTDARPFPGIRETIETLRGHDVAPHRVIIAYNPERREREPGTPVEEVDNLVDSVRRAKRMAQEYGAPLLVGPGLREMMQREHLYPELASHCDIWMIQSQRLQLDPDTREPVNPGEYRERVNRIIDRLRQGNPEIRIFVQIVTHAGRPRRVLAAEQVAAYALAIEDNVDAVRIYGASGELLREIVALLKEAPR